MFVASFIDAPQKYYAAADGDYDIIKMPKMQ